MTEAMLRVIRIEVHGLFGRYDHDIELNQADRVTVLHGPNGVGKTVLLGMTRDLLRGRTGTLRRVPFELFRVSFDDGSALAVERVESGKGAGETWLRLDKAGQKARHVEVELRAVDERALRRAENRPPPWIMRVGPDRWFDEQDGEVLNTAELLELYGDQLPLFGLQLPPEASWYSTLCKRLRVHVIEADRLVRRKAPSERDRPGRPREKWAVDAQAADLRKTLAAAQGEYAQLSQQLDQSFPSRVLGSGGELRVLQVPELQRELKVIKKRQADLAELGLLDQPLKPPLPATDFRGLDETERKVLSVYVEDTLAKLKVLEPLAGRVRPLLDNLNAKLLDKRVRIDREEGLVVETEGGGDLVDLSWLSSGEQHELVVQYELLFRVRENTLVLIDEPELSLHVDWQRHFLPELLAIVEAAKFDVLLATHSPGIAGARPELMVDLTARAESAGGPAGAS